MWTQPLIRPTPLQNLERERKANFKSEFYQGEVFAKVGGNCEHHLSVDNLVGELRQAPNESTCEVYPSDMRVKVSDTVLYTCPDATIACGKPAFEDNQFDTQLKPTVLLKVLSESTEGYDRGTKAAHYRKLASIQHYVLVSQCSCSVELYSRSNDKEWTSSEGGHWTGLHPLQTPSVVVSMAEIYPNIRLDKAGVAFGLTQTTISETFCCTSIHSRVQTYEC